MLAGVQLHFFILLHVLLDKLLLWNTPGWRCCHLWHSATCCSHQAPLIKWIINCSTCIQVPRFLGLCLCLGLGLYTSATSATVYYTMFVRNFIVNRETTHTATKTRFATLLPTPLVELSSEILRPSKSMRRFFSQQLCRVVHCVSCIHVSDLVTCISVSYVL